MNKKLISTDCRLPYIQVSLQCNPDYFSLIKMELKKRKYLPIGNSYSCDAFNITCTEQKQFILCFKENRLYLAIFFYKPIKNFEPFLSKNSIQDIIFSAIPMHANICSEINSISLEISEAVGE